MVKCADAVTPCHLGFYQLNGRACDVQAYPDGTLELTVKGQQLTSEKGQWTNQ